MTQIAVAATLSDGSMTDVSLRALGSTYQTSNADLITVDQEGVVTANANRPGVGFITVSNEGATSVARVAVTADLISSTIDGFVQLPPQTPVAAATVSAVSVLPGLVTVVGSAMTDVDGHFSIPLTAIPVEATVIVRATVNVAGQPFNASVRVDPLARDGFTDAGIIVLEADPDLPVTNGLTVWLRANRIDGLSGDAVGIWFDESGQGNDFTQATPTAQPTLAGFVLNGLPVVRFDGVNDGLRVPGRLISGNSFTLFTVMSLKQGSIWPWQIGSGTDRNRVFYEDSDFGGGNVNSIDIGHDFGNDARATLPGIADSSFKVLGIVADQNLAGTKVYMNGNAASMSVLRSNLQWTFTAGGNWLARFDFPVAFAEADFAEFILYDRALSQSERQEVEQYLTLKYFVP